MRLIASRRQLRSLGRAALTHANADGTPVLVTAASWRTVNGVMLNSRCGYVIWLFRRTGAPLAPRRRASDVPHPTRSARHWAGTR